MASSSDKPSNRRLQVFGIWAEIVAAIAVIISLIFVGLEVRQNTRSTQVSAYQDLIAQFGNMNTLLVENPEFAELDRRVQAGGTPETEAEWQQYTAWMRLHVRHGDMAFHQFEMGLIDQARLESALGPVRAMLRHKVGSDYWETRADLSPAYRAYVEGMVAEQ